MTNDDFLSHAIVDFELNLLTSYMINEICLW